VAWEIERRYLVQVDDGLWARLGPGAELRQGYIRVDAPSVRIRTGEPRGAVLACKSGSGVRRTEVEAVVPDEMAEVLFGATDGRVVEKTRWRLGPWELDRFKGALEGLELLEVELETEDEAMPEYPEGVTILREVTEDNRFVSSGLASLPEQEQRRFVRDIYKEMSP
jgi:CYTH domain-containing protein